MTSCSKLRSTTTTSTVIRYISSIPSGRPLLLATMLLSTIILIYIPVSIHSFSPPLTRRSIRVTNNHHKLLISTHQQTSHHPRDDVSLQATSAADAATDISKLKVVELKDRLRELSLPLSGNKSELVERLSEHYRLLS